MLVLYLLNRAGFCVLGAHTQQQQRQMESIPNDGPLQEEVSSVDYEAMPGLSSDLLSYCSGRERRSHLPQASLLSALGHLQLC